MLKRSRILSVFLLFCVLLSSCAIDIDVFNENSKFANSDFSDFDGIELQYLDVGQGDSTFVKLPDNTTLLIDGGDVFCRDKLNEYISSIKTDKIDYIVATHPHADHIGGLPEIFDNFEVGTLIMPKVADKDVPTTRAYEVFLDSVIQNGCKVERATSEKQIYSHDDVSVECLGPCEDSYSNLNSYSAVIRITYKDVSFIFTGDAQFDSEKQILSTGADVRADVIKIGHHGSSTSTSNEFLAAVNPRYAIISLGSGNRYGHPHHEIIEKLRDLGKKIYRTDEDGTVIVRSDGKDISISTSEIKLY